MRARDNYFVWTDDEVELLLKVTLKYRAVMAAHHIDWESSQSKYGDIFQRYLELYPSPEKARAMGKDFPHRKEELTQGYPAINGISEGIETGDVSVEAMPGGDRVAEDAAYVEMVADRRQTLDATQVGYRGEKLKRPLGSTENPSDSVAQEDTDIKRRLLQRLDTTDGEFMQTMGLWSSTVDRLTSNIELLVERIEPCPENCTQSSNTIMIKSDPEMDVQLRIGFIGAGNMAYGIAKGILSGDILPVNVKVSAPSSRNFGRFEELGITVTHSNSDLVSGSDVVFVAVKPHLVPGVLGEISQLVTQKHIIVSVAAGITLATLEQLLPVNTVILRLMPNLPCLLQEGALLFSRGSCAKPEDAALLSTLLQHCGLVEEGPETWIDVHTGLSGSGVAFVYLFAEALAEGAVKMGMPSSLAHSIAAQTLVGAGRMLRDTGKHPAQLRSDVCTPGGTTIYGLHTLEQGGLRAATMSAVESATERARELGQKTAAAGSTRLQEVLLTTRPHFLLLLAVTADYRRKARVSHRPQFISHKKTTVSVVDGR
ncbi:unnamed protein product [Merluccius merluccius]